MVPKSQAHERNPDLVGNIRAIKADIARLQGLLDAASAELHGGGGGTPSGASRSITAKKPFISARLVGGKHPAMELVTGSSAFLAAEAIREAGRPLHMRDLVKAIEAQGHKVKPTTLMGSLFRWHKKRSIFYRAGRNTFGLIEMRK